MKFKIILLTIFCVLSINTGAAEEIYNQSFNFLGTSPNYYTVTQSGVGSPNCAESTCSFYGALRNISVNFDNVESINELELIGSGYWGAAYNDLQLSASADGLVQKYTSFNAYMGDGTLYGSGSIGWHRRDWSLTDSTINYHLIFDTSTIDSDYARSLSGEQFLRLDYNFSIFSVYINADTGAGTPSNWTTGASNTYATGYIYIFQSNPGTSTFLGLSNSAEQSYISSEYDNTLTVTANNQSSVLTLVNITKQTVNYHAILLNQSGHELYNLQSTDDISELLVSSYGVSFAISHPDETDWINRTILGAVSISPTPTPSVTPNPATGGGILFDKNTYYINEISNISYNFSTSAWFDFLVTKKIDIYDPSGALVKSDTLPSQSGFYLYQLNVIGEYEVRLEKYIKGFPTVLTTYDTDTAVVVDALQPYLFTNATAPANKNVTVQFRYGYDVKNNLYNNGIKMFRHNPATNTFELEKYSLVLSNNSVATLNANTLYTDNISFPKAGDYSLCLWSAIDAKCLVDNVKVKAVFDAVTPTMNITRSYINITSGDVYSWNDVLMGGYAVDNTNYSSYSISIAITNENENIETINQVVPDQTGSFTIPIQNTDTYNPSDYYNIIGQPWTKLYFIAGTNTISLNATNGTHTIELARDNFTLANTDSDGYGLQFSKTSLCLGETLLLTATSPATQSQVIIDRMDQLRYNLLRVNITGTKTVTFKNTNTPSTLYVALIDDSGRTRFTNNVVVSDCAAEAVPTTPTQQGSLIYNNLLNLMMLPIFWGVILWNGGVLAMIQRRAQNVGLYGFLWGNLLAIAGLFAPYTVYLLVIFWIGAGVYFQVGRRIIGAR